MFGTYKLPKAVLSLLLIAAFCCHFFCTPAEDKAPAENSLATEKKELTKDEMLGRGSYIVNTSGCNDCHSPKIMTAAGPEPDTTRLLSGTPAGTKIPAITYDATKPGNWVLILPDLTAAIGPWGMTYAANLTPDSATGMGSWSVDQFVNAMRTGKHLGQPGGRPILPPMPWPQLAKMTDEDLKCVFMFLQSLPAIKNAVPAPVPPDKIGIVK